METEIKMRYVYKITNLITGEFYIGRTSLLGKRRQKHMTNSDIRNVRKSVNKYGSERHSFVVLYGHDVDEETIKLCESMYLSLYGKNNPLCMNVRFPYETYYSEIKSSPSIDLENNINIYWRERFVRELCTRSDGRINKLTMRHGYASLEYAKQCVIQGRILGDYSSFPRGYISVDYGNQK